MPSQARRMKPLEPLHDANEVQAETPSGPVVATARAFNPKRVGWSKTACALGIVAANAALFLCIDKGWVPADGMFAVFLGQVFGLLTAPVIRHLGTRWKTP